MTGNNGTPCVVLGGGGHAAVVIEILRESGVAQPTAVLERDQGMWGADVLGVPVLGGDDKFADLLRDGIGHFIVGVGATGNTAPRRELFERAGEAGLTPLSATHPAATVSGHCEIHDGTVVCAQAVVGPRALIGGNVIVNTAAVVEHDCVVGDHTHVATGARLAGTVKTGIGVHIGAGAVVKESVSIGEGALIGAGAVVIRDVAPGTKVVGVPAKPIPHHSLEDR